MPRAPNFTTLAQQANPKNQYEKQIDRLKEPSRLPIASAVPSTAS